jgi:hypothetical protein
MNEPKWETVQRDRDRSTTRLAVPGGWLYIVAEKGEMGAIYAQYMAFVPKPPTTPRRPKADEP